MTYFELLFVVWNCLGDARVPVLGSVRPIPEAARPLLAAVRLASGSPVCAPRATLERYPVRAEAEARVKALGPGAAPRLRWCRGWRCQDWEILWKDRLIINSREIK